MDFLPLYPLSSPSHSHVSFSPGSTFLVSLVDRTIVVRTADSLALVRSWTLPSTHPPVDELAWSPDGAYILAHSAASGSIDVFLLDPRRQPDEGVLDDHGQDAGAVAAIQTGSSGSVAATWAPAVAPSTICTFGGDELGMTAHCLVDSTKAFFPNVKRARYYPHPNDRSRMALLHRACEDNNNTETISIYRYIPTSAPSGYAALIGNSSSSSRSSLASNWILEVSFPCRTNDAHAIAWSPDGSLVAVWEGPLEYKLLLFTATGQPRGTLMIPNEPDAEGSDPRFFAPEDSLGELTKADLGSSINGSKKGEDTGEDEARVYAGGGLGIRSVAWQPVPGKGSVGLLAIGGYDERVHLLTPHADSPHTTSFSLLPSPLVLSRKSFTSSYPTSCVFREPRNWLQSSGSTGIVGFSKSDWPVSPLAVKADWNVARPKVGVCWMQWEPNGQLLAARNENMPSTLFVFILPTATSSPVLLSVVTFSSTISCCTWRPAPSSSADQRQQKATSNVRNPQLAIATGTAAVYLWEHLPVAGQVDRAGSPQRKQRMEGVPVPVTPGRSFYPSMVKYSPDGSRLLLAAGPSGGAGVTANLSSSIVSDGRAEEDDALSPTGGEGWGALCVGTPVDDDES